jgi:small subunit ribosomal protein S6
MSQVRQYELVYIVPPDTTEEVLADLHQQVTAIVERFGGKIERTEPWGRRRLAYDINNQREGTYVLEVISGPGALTAELDRRLRVIDTVMRHLIVRVDEEFAVAERAKTRRKAATVARRLRRGLPPEPTETELHRRREEDDDLDMAGEFGQFRGERGERGDRGERADRGERGER